MVVWGASASAQSALAPEVSVRPLERPVQLPNDELAKDVALCGVGGLTVAAVVSGTGVGGVAAGVLVGICAIITHDVRWHLKGGRH